MLTLPGHRQLSRAGGDTDPIILEVRRVVEGARGAAAVQVGVVGAVHHIGAAHRHAAAGPPARPMPAAPRLRPAPQRPA